MGRLYGVFHCKFATFVLLHHVLRPVLFWCIITVCCQWSQGWKTPIKQANKHESSDLHYVDIGIIGLLLHSSRSAWTSLVGTLKRESVTIHSSHTPRSKMSHKCSIGLRKGFLQTIPAWRFTSVICAKVGIPDTDLHVYFSLQHVQEHRVVFRTIVLMCKPTIRLQRSTQICVR